MYDHWTELSLNEKLFRISDLSLLMLSIEGNVPLNDWEIEIIENKKLKRTKSERNFLNEFQNVWVF